MDKHQVQKDTKTQPHRQIAGPPYLQAGRQGTKTFKRPVVCPMLPIQVAGNFSYLRETSAKGTSDGEQH
jgi:hypothetical protein